MIFEVGKKGSGKMPTNLQNVLLKVINFGSKAVGLKLN